jgi:Spy/CpxP family protein refolding chaperone
MKAYKIITLLALLITSCTFAQPGSKQKKEQIKALKVAFITDELKLTPDEAAKFWPIYNAFDDKQRELRHEKMRSYMNRIDNGEVEKMSEKEAAHLLSQMENTEDELYQLRKKFIVNLKTVLPAVKIIKLKSAEEDFNRKLLKQYRGQGPRP